MNTQKTMPAPTGSTKLRRVLLIIAISLFAVVSSYVTITMVTPVGASMKKTGLHSVDQSIEIALSPTVGEIPLDAITFEPAISGTWQRIEEGLGKTDSLLFQPDAAFLVDTEYTISFPEITHITRGKTKVPSIRFTTESAPGLMKSGLETLQTGSIIPADQSLEISLTSKNRGLRQLELRIQPNIVLEPEVSDDQTYTWSYKNYLPQGKKVAVEVYDTKNKQSLLSKEFTVAKVPSITQAVKQSGFTDKDTAVIVFGKPISNDSRDKVKFSLAGDGTWKNDTTYEFRPTKVEPGKTYSYSIEKGFRTKEGGIVTKTIAKEFRTVGPVTASSPSRGSELSQKHQQIKFAFSQPVDKASAESRFSVSSGTITGMSWSGNTLTVGVKDLGFQRTVTATMAAGVKNTTFGLPSQTAVSTRFTTEVKTRRLSVPHYRQQKTATCVAASLRMALAFYGVQRDEMTLVRAMGYKPRDMDRSKKPYTWDDPAEMFVGRVDGGAYQSAGPDAPPAAKAAIASGRSASAVRGISAEWIAKQIYEGHPVIMYGATKDTGFMTWKTPSGGTAKMNISSHATVVTGVKGNANAPLGFWVNDPMASGPAYWTVDMVRTNIARDAYRQAVVVY